jgi:NTE family protein
MDPANKGDRPRRGIVLSGGGARGAYEVGVLRYLCEHIKEVPLFDVITGTSVGAINGAYLASTSDRPRAAGRLMARMWATLTLDEFYKFGWTQVRMLPRVLFGKNLPKLTHGAVVGGLLDSSCVEEIVRDKIRWRGITDNLYRGVLDAVSCSATELATGINTVFVQTASGRLPRPWPRDPGQTVVLTALAAAHTLASAALPLLFPAVRVGDQLYVDGSMRQNTPVTPALRLGASRLLVISLRHEEEIPAATRRKRESARAVYPNALFMLGKMFNALMLDKLEADLHRIRRTNDMIAAGSRLYGEDYPGRIAAEMAGDKKARPYIPLEVVQVRPSQDLGKMAFDCIQRTRLHHYEGVMARWLRRLVLSAQEAAESDLASYVLFDPEYITQLIELGYQDAARQRDELKSLFE